jgi:hypothetical protein
MTTTIDWPTLYVPTPAGTAYIRTFTRCLIAGYPTRTAIEIAERAAERQRMLSEQEEKAS